MSKICQYCKHFEPIGDNSIYSEPFDGHCVIDGVLVYADDVCDMDELRPFDQEW